MESGNSLDWPTVFSPFFDKGQWSVTVVGDDKELEGNLVDMWRTFRVSEVEVGRAAILVEETKPKELKEKGHFSLLAKLFTFKRFNRKSMKTPLWNLWNPKRDTKCKELGDNLLIFAFNDRYNMVRVVRISSW